MYLHTKLYCKAIHIILKIIVNYYILACPLTNILQNYYKINVYSLKKYKICTVPDFLCQAQYNANLKNQILLKSL